MTPPCARWKRLRLRVLAAHLAAPYPRMIRVRGAQALNRLTADIDALDGVPLRLVLPVMAGLAVQVLALVALWCSGGACGRAVGGGRLSAWRGIGFWLDGAGIACPCRAGSRWRRRRFAPG